MQPESSNQNILEEIEDLAASAMSMSEIETILQIEDLFLAPANLLAYQKGKLKAKAQLNKAIKQLASQGSGPAQELFLKLLKIQESNEN